jgi:REP element-mobilizing transposase RayT
MPLIEMTRIRRWPVELTLAACGGHGGWRAGAGRKPKREGEHKGHRPRPALASRFPVHVTLKTLASAPRLRRGVCFRVVRSALAAGKDKGGFRLVHFTVQGTHLHLLCEAKDKQTLSRGMQGLAIRIARGLNKKLDRRGRLFAERFHERILRTPTEVRRALAYVLNNSRRHDPEKFSSYWIDPCSSAPWFTGWRSQLREPWARAEGEPPVVPAQTWLLTEGWRRVGGLLYLDEIGAVHLAGDAAPIDGPPRR